MASLAATPDDGDAAVAPKASTPITPVATAISITSTNTTLGEETGKFQFTAVEASNRRCGHRLRGCKVREAFYLYRERS